MKNWAVKQDNRVWYAIVVPCFCEH